MAKRRAKKQSVNIHANTERTVQWVSVHRRKNSANLTASYEAGYGSMYRCADEWSCCRCGQLDSSAGIEPADLLIRKALPSSCGDAGVAACTRRAFSVNGCNE